MNTIIFWLANIFLTILIFNKDTRNYLIRAFPDFLWPGLASNKTLNIPLRNNPTKKAATQNIFFQFRQLF